MIRTRTLLPFTLVAALAILLFACGSGWREYRSDAGRYSVQLPAGEVKVQEQRDGPLIVHIVSLEVDQGTAYGVAWYDEPAATDTAKPVNDRLIERQTKVLRDINAGVSQAGELKLGEHPGRAFTARTTAGLNVSIRLYAAGSNPTRVYQLIAAYADPARAEPSVKKFMDSFALTK